MTRRNSGVKGAINPEDIDKTSKKAVIRYIICLVASVLFFVALSYLIQVRENERIDRLYSENATVVQRIETLREEYGALQEQYDELLASYNNLLDKIGTEVDIND